MICPLLNRRCLDAHEDISDYSQLIYCIDTTVYNCSLSSGQCPHIHAFPCYTNQIINSFYTNRHPVTPLSTSYNRYRHLMIVLLIPRGDRRIYILFVMYEVVMYAVNYLLTYVGHPNIGQW